MEIIGVDWRCVDYPRFTRLGSALIALWPESDAPAAASVYFRIGVAEMPAAERLVREASDMKLDRGEVWSLLDREFHKGEA